MTWLRDPDRNECEHCWHWIGTLYPTVFGHYGKVCCKCAAKNDTPTVELAYISVDSKGHGMFAPKFWLT